MEESKTNGVWPVATIAVVLVGMGTVFYGMASQQSEIGRMRDAHQSQIVQLLHGFQTSKSEDLDKLLQTEIRKEAELVRKTFDQANEASQNRHVQANEASQERHNEQERRIDAIVERIEDIVSWFKPPQLREDGRYNGGDP